MASISTQMLLAINHDRTVAEAAVPPRMNALREISSNSPARRRPADLHRFGTTQIERRLDRLRSMRQNTDGVLCY